MRASDGFVLGALVDALGSWVLLVIPRVVEPTAWPWFALVASLEGLACAVAALRRSKREREAQKPEPEEGRGEDPQRSQEAAV